MSSPIINPKVDLYLAGDWSERTTDVRQNPPIQITGGTKDEASNISPSRAKFTLNGMDYNPRNPMGPWFGDIGKNTKVRVRVPLLEDNVSQTDTDGWGTVWTNGPSSGGVVVDTDWTRTGTANRHAVPAANAYRRSLITGKQYMDICARTRMQLSTILISGAAVATEFEFRYIDSSNYVAAQVIFNTNQTASIQVVDVVAGANRVLFPATVIPAIGGVSVNTFEIAALVEGPIVRVKAWRTGDAEPADWQVVCGRASVRYGQLATVSAIVTGNTNTKPFNFTYSNMVMEARPFVGEISEYIPRFEDETHAGPSVEITASGITQRTIAGSEPFKSAMFRWWSADQKWVREGNAVANPVANSTGTTSTIRIPDAGADGAEVGYFFALLNKFGGSSFQGTGKLKEDQIFTITSKSSSAGTTTINFVPHATDVTVQGDNLRINRFGDSTDQPVVYWPCEDGRDSTSVASGIKDGKAMQYRVAVPEFASKDDFMGSAPLLKLNNAELYSTVDGFPAGATAYAWHWLLSMPSTDDAGTGTNFITFYTSGTAELWQLAYTAAGGGSIQIAATDTPTGTTLFSDTWDMQVRGKPVMMTLVVRQGTPCTYTLSVVSFTPDGNVAPLVANGTATGVNALGRPTYIRVNPDGGYVDVGFGHLALEPNNIDYFNTMDAAKGYAAEEVLRRVLRLSYEEDIPITFYGSLNPGTAKMGAQRQDTVLANLQDAVEFDGGRFYEARGDYSFEIRSLATLYKQTPYMEIDYSLGGVLADMIPKDDDKDIRNDVTAKRIKGGFSRAVLETGRLSVLSPANGGSGRYTQSVDIAAQKDDQLPNQANWRLHLGTTDEERYPIIKLKPQGGITLEQLFSTGVGNRFNLYNLSKRNIYERVDQLVLGYKFVLHPYDPYVEINGEPARRYNVSDLDAVRLDHTECLLNEALDTTETGVDVFSLGSTFWTTVGANFPFDIMIGGERMTVSSISGSGQAQTMTVTRSVNGVVKTHNSGEQVSLADPFYLAL